MPPIDADTFWDHDADEQPPGATPAEIEAAERALGVKLPEAYLALFRRQNGGYPACNTYLDLTRNVCWTRVFEDGPHPLQRLETLQQFADGIDFGGDYGWQEFLEGMALMVVIASHGSDALTCLDYRACGPRGEPEVVEVDAVSGPQIRHRVCNFAQLLAGLCEPSDAELERGFVGAQGTLIQPFETRRQDTPEFIATLLRLRERDALAGDVDAMQTLGKIYGNWNDFYAAQGYPVDGERSRQWFSRALQTLRDEAASDDADTAPIAMRKLGEAYQDGLGTEADRAEARRWYERAAEQGEFWAMLALARLLMDNHPPEMEEAERWAHQAKAAWDVSFADDVLSALAHKKEELVLLAAQDDEADEEDTPQARADALDGMLQAARAGDVQAMIEVAKWHAYGEGGAEDVTEAARWYRLAADRQDDGSAQGSSAAMAWLGYACVAGRLRDGERDPVLGYAWYALAGRERYNRVDPATRQLVAQWLEFCRDQRDRIEPLLSEPQLAQARAILAACDAGPPHTLPEWPCAVPVL